MVRPPILRARREPVGGEGFAGGVEPGSHDGKREIGQSIGRKSFAESGEVQPCSRWVYPTAGGNVFERGQAVFGKGWSVCEDSWVYPAAGKAVFKDGWTIPRRDNTNYVN